ncbi:hypothetical protein SARC_10029 [Sphaeroforma arctica JP610]|uniref:Uncharacterized protein n=1 Tax=Sphaeroforma arctica JP610 TaxID=667725 RepID=A0A0L0FL42_9EUKA|nr:hypothetical protein SARC_10029 [Sphaeroforma arctica JP610]KNC77507.1 hypothetical protein SARC_10029 [Sphaeroforma arctica JP610]|eukprot:XP_014151409.1 hypothetical protein SARC_10029 [Sphaeroforma arctica JP610]
MTEVDAMGLPVGDQGREEQIQRLVRENREITLKYGLLHKNYLKLRDLVTTIKENGKKERAEFVESVTDLRARNKGRTERLARKVTELQAVIASPNSSQSRCVSCVGKDLAIGEKNATIVEKDTAIGVLTEEKEALDKELESLRSGDQGDAKACEQCVIKDDTIYALAVELEQSKSMNEDKAGVCESCVEKDTRIEKLETEKNVKVAEIKEKDTKLDELETECAEYIVVIEEMKESSDEKDREIEELMADTAKECDGCAEKSATIDDLNGSCHEKHIRIDELVAEKSNNEVDMKKCDECAEKDAKVKELEPTVEQLESTVEQLESGKNKECDDCAEKSTVIEELAERCDEKETRVAELEAEMSKECDGCAEKSTAMAELAERCDEKDTRITELEAECADKSAAAEELAQLCDEKETIIDDLEREMESKDTERKECDECADRDAVIEGLTIELDKALNNDEVSTTECSECADKDTRISELCEALATTGDNNIVVAASNQDGAEGVEKDDMDRNTQIAEELEKEPYESEVKECRECAENTSRVADLSDELETRYGIIDELRRELNTRDSTIADLRDDEKKRQVCDEGTAKDAQIKATVEDSATVTSDDDTILICGESERTECTACAEKDAVILEMAEELVASNVANTHTNETSQGDSECADDVAQATDALADSAESEAKKESASHDGWGGDYECGECEQLQVELELMEDEMDSLRLRLETAESVETVGECVPCAERAAVKGGELDSQVDDKTDTDGCAKCVQLEATIDELEEELEGKKKSPKSSGECAVCAEKDEKIERLEEELGVKHSKSDSSHRCGACGGNGSSDGAEAGGQEAESDGSEAGQGDSQDRVKANGEQVDNVGEIEDKDALIDELRRELAASRKGDTTDEGGSSTCAEKDDTIEEQEVMIEVLREEVKELEARGANTEGDEMHEGTCGKCAERDARAQHGEVEEGDVGEQECPACVQNKDAYENKDRLFEEKNAEIGEKVEAIRALEAKLQEMKELSHVNQHKTTEGIDEQLEVDATSAEQAKYNGDQEEGEDSQDEKMTCKECLHKVVKIEEKDELIDELTRELEASRKEVITDDEDCLKCAEKDDAIKEKDDIIEEKEVMIEVLTNDLKELEDRSHNAEGDQEDCAECAEKNARIDELEAKEDAPLQGECGECVAKEDVIKQLQADATGEHREGTCKCGERDVQYQDVVADERDGGQVCHKCIQNAEQLESRDKMLSEKDAEIDEKVEEIKALQADSEAMKKEDVDPTRTPAGSNWVTECASCKRTNTSLVVVRPPSIETIEELQRLAALAQPLSKGFFGLFGSVSEPHIPCSECKEKDNTIEELELKLWYKQPGVVVYERPPKDESLETLQMLARKQISSKPKPVFTEPVVQVFLGVFVGLFYAMQTNEHWRDYNLADMLLY